MLRSEIETCLALHSAREFEQDLWGLSQQRYAHILIGDDVHLLPFPVFPISLPQELSGPDPMTRVKFYRGISKYKDRLQKTRVPAELFT